MKIELKKISFNERMSEETNCFIADLYIDGKKVGYCKNDGRGGCTDYNGNTSEDNKVLREAEAYFKTLPKVKSKEFNFEYQPSLEGVIDDLLEKHLIEKAEKKMQKLMETAIVFGEPDGMSYRYYNFKKPLSSINRKYMQLRINEIKGKYCTGNVQILNTNLNDLGINI